MTDPNGIGLVGANLTGIRANTTENDAPRLNLLIQLMPGIQTIGVLTNSKRPNFSLAGLQAAAPGVALVQADVPVTNGNSSAAIDALITNGFARFKTNNVQAVLVAADPLFNNHRAQVLSLAASYSYPAIYQWREFVDAGGLMSFGTNITLAYYLAGIYVGRIVAGTPFANLPRISLASTELVINLSTATALGIAIPDAVLAQANEVIV